MFNDLINRLNTRQNKENDNIAGKIVETVCFTWKRDDNVKGFVLCNKSKEKDTMVEYNCE